MTEDARTLAERLAAGLPSDAPIPDPPEAAEVRVDQLPAAVRDLLTAVLAALDLPPANTTEDHHARAEILDRRASDASIILAAVIRGDRVADCAEQLLGWTANRPVTYTVWVPETAKGGGQL